MITAEHVGKIFQRRRHTVEALRDVSVEVADGEFVTLLGPSGCGKSTLLRIIGGLQPATSGRVVVAGRTPGEARAAKLFGLVPQAPALMPWKTLAANVRLLTDLHPGGGDHPSMTDEQIDELLDTVGLAGFARSYPHELSGGMRQRASLVRAFALGAPVLLMDEPFAALDEITRADMRYLLLDLWTRRRGTVVFVTHSITEAVILSDRVAVMASHPGRISAVRPIDLPRPRSSEVEDTDAFHEHVRVLRNDLRESHALVR